MQENPCAAILLDCMETDLPLSDIVSCPSEGQGNTGPAYIDEYMAYSLKPTLHQ